MWHVSASYPEAASAGVAVLLGEQSSSAVPGRGRFIRGVQATVDAGPGGASARIGWADLVAYDAGIEGWSYEVVYLRPWLLRWGLDPATNYLGAGVTHYLGFIRLSGALVLSTSSSQVAPAFSAGFVFQIH